MAHGTRAASFIAIAICILTAGVCAYFYRLQVQEKQRRISAEHRAEGLQREIDLLVAKNAELGQLLEEARQLASDFEKERDQQARLVATYQADLEALQTNLAQRQAEAAAPPVQEAPAGEAAPTEPRKPLTFPAATAHLGRRLARVAASRRELEEELAEVRREREELEKKVLARERQLPGAVPIGEITVPTGRRIVGRVLVVNERYTFVVIDVGRRDGIEKDMVMILHRGKTFIGKVQVVKVYHKMAAADLLLDWMQDDVQVNDGVRKF